MAYTEKYVTVSGAGAHDGTSEGNAWTFEEMIAAVPTGGSRINIKVGTHTLTANRTLPAGTSENPIPYRGYNSTIGDLETVGRATATGALDTTNFPVIDCTGSFSLTTGVFTKLQNLKVTSGANAPTVTFANTASAWRSSFANTHANGGSAKAVSGGNYGSVVDCDASIASTNASADVIAATRSTVYGCRVWHTGTPSAACAGITLSDVGAAAVGNIIFHVGNAIELGGTMSCAVGNTIYDCNDGIVAAGAAQIIAENIIYSMAGYGIEGVASSGDPILWNNAMGAVTSGRLDSGGLGSYIEEIGAVTLTGDPFTDAANKDFTLNNTAGAGALCRGGSLRFGGHCDIGAVQHADAGGGGLLTHPGYSGRV